MDDHFILPVTFEGNDLELPARLLQHGYTVKIEVTIADTPVIFEPDEERNWRAVMGYEDLIAGKKVKRELLEVVAGIIDQYTK